MDQSTEQSSKANDQDEMVWSSFLQMTLFGLGDTQHNNNDIHHHHHHHHHCNNDDIQQLDESSLRSLSHQRIDNPTTTTTMTSLQSIESIPIAALPISLPSSPTPASVIASLDDPFGKPTSSLATVVVSSDDGNGNDKKNNRTAKPKRNKRSSKKSKVTKDDDHVDQKNGCVTNQESNNNNGNSKVKSTSPTLLPSSRVRRHNNDIVTSDNAAGTCRALKEELTYFIRPRPDHPDNPRGNIYETNIISSDAIPYVIMVMVMVMGGLILVMFVVRELDQKLLRDHHNVQISHSELEAAKLQSQKPGIHHATSIDHEDDESLSTTTTCVPSSANDSSNTSHDSNSIDEVDLKGLSSSTSPKGAMKKKSKKRFRPNCGITTSAATEQSHRCIHYYFTETIARRSVWYV
jgi:hypothetical protein